MLYRHLQFLDGLVPQNNEAAARLWINAFLYRVAAMTPSGSNMVLKVKQAVPSITISTSPHIVTGYVDWTAMAISPEKSKGFLRRPFLRNLKSEDFALFVSEAKGPNQDLESHIPQVLFEMHGCARLAAKTTIRGAVTNGRSWIFLILTLDKNGGGSFLQSSQLTCYSNYYSQDMTEKVWKGGSL